jgi:drug/metabolite transporter (DMT)-like permease
VSLSLKSWLILLFLSLTWGSSYILIKKGLLFFTAEEVAALRVAISFLAFLPVFIARAAKIDWSKWKYYLIVGLTGNAIPAFLFATAQTKLSSSLTGVLSSSTPLFTLIFGVLFFGTAVRWSRTAGILIGLAGAILLILYGNTSVEHSESTVFYGILVAIATSCYAISSNVVKAFLQNISSITLSAVVFFLIGVPALIYLAAIGLPAKLIHQPQAWEGIGYISILSVAGTVIASILFFQLVQLKDAIFASTVSYLIPLIAIFWGFTDGEELGIYHFIGMTLILSGVYLSRNSTKKSQ